MINPQPQRHNHSSICEVGPANLFQITRGRQLEQSLTAVDHGPLHSRCAVAPPPARPHPPLGTMANADAPVLSPPPAWRSVAAALVRSRRARAVAAVTAAIDLTLTMVWLLFASLGVRRIGLAACGEGCAVVAAAEGILRAAAASLVMLCFVSLVAAFCSICVAIGNVTATEKVRRKPIDSLWIQFHLCPLRI